MQSNSREGGRVSVFPTEKKISRTKFSAPAAPPNFGVLPSPEAPIQQTQNWYSGTLQCHKQAHIVKPGTYKEDATFGGKVHLSS